MRRHLYGLLAAVAAWVGCLGAAGPAAADAPARFEPVTCDLPDIADVASRLRCGTVRVPRDHAHPDGPTFALAVVIVASARQPAEPDPIVYISGGPGSPLTIYAGYQARHPYGPDRDLILVDQRGTGRSEPRLCPGRQAGLVNAMLAVLAEPGQASVAADREAHLACRDAIRRDGVDLDNFGTATTVEDFEWVRRALGIARWNVVGESYGTTVAMTLLARHPEGVRSAVLDSLNPPDSYFGAPWSERVADAREAFFAACRRDAACDRAFPDLAGAYRQTIDGRSREAPPVPLPPRLHVSGDQIRLSPALFEEVVGRLVYYRALSARLPAVIRATLAGDLGPVRAALSTLLAGAQASGNEAAFVAVECRDRPGWRAPGREEANPLDVALLPPGVCGEWSSLGPEPEVPHDSAAPVLVLQGEFDPNIRPPTSRRVADLIGPRTRWIEVRGVGHSVRGQSPCAAGIVAAFIAAPAGDLDTACAAAGPPILSGTP